MSKRATWDIQMLLLRLCFCLSVIVFAALVAATPQALAQSRDVGDQPGHVPDAADENLPPQFQRQAVFFRSSEPPGTIVVHTSERFLYVVQSNGRAMRYGIGVGRDGFQWQGLLKITRKQEWPDWTPPPEMIERQPYLPRFMAGGPGNPMGARALYLGNTIYRIHGTNNDRTVGRANSSGCFRLTNEHVVHLASIAKVGTKVKVLQTYAGGVSETAPLSSLFSFWGSEPAKPVARPKAARPVVKKATPVVAKTAPPPAKAAPSPPTEAKAAPSAEASKGAQ